jgi:DNA-binding GntR family transcriptional regulator
MARLFFNTKSGMVFQKLKEDIMKGRYKSGQKIVITDFARQFGVSESPVREAIKKLESEGFIENIPYSGPIVKTMDMEDMKKIYPIRIEIQGLASRLAAHKIKDIDLIVLEKSIQDMEEAYRGKKYNKAESINRKFHAVITEAAENEYIEKIASDLVNLCFKTFMPPGIFGVIPEIVPSLIQDHRDILDALKKRDEFLAEQLTQKHIAYAFEKIQKYHKKTILNN